MHRVTRWFDRGNAAVDSSSLDPVAEAKSMEGALVAANLFLNDDLAGAEAELAKGHSAFHKLARGAIGFTKATLGFEQDAMREASDLLSEAENTAHLFHQKAIYDSNVVGSKIYGRGSEFALCQAESQIMNAVVGILNESLTEAIKGFYKVRKAYITLNQLAQKENEFVKQMDLQPLTKRNMSKESGFTHELQNNLEASTGIRKHDNNDNYDSDEEDEFHDAEDSHVNVTQHFDSDVETSKEKSLEAMTSNLNVSSASSVKSKDMTPFPSGVTTPMLQAGVITPQEDVPLVSQLGLLNADADSEIFSDSLDVFIHSGVNFMSGLINLLLSIIPPTFARLLSIIGFRGERERGLRMLWQASKFPNINGGMAALALFAWYNGVIGFCDIITDADPGVQDDVNGFPVARLHALLARMRKQYPGSLFWKLEEARTFSTARQIDKALVILNQPHQSQMRQLQAFHMWEKSLDYMNSHQYELCARAFVECVDLNSWSQALYYYTAACAYLQLYREAKTAGDEKATVKYKSLAEEYFRLAPTKVGKKKMMGRQLPFDTFAMRKVAKWTERANNWNCDLADAVGAAPLDEIGGMWNGFKKMNEAQLNKSLQNLAWQEKYSPYWDKEDENEKAIIDVLKATVLRNLRRHKEAEALLGEKLLSYDAHTFRGANQDDWVAPAANYEKATNLWMQRKEYISRYGSTLAGIEADTGRVYEQDLEHDAVLVAEAKKYLEKAKNWGNYSMNVRIGMKVTGGYNAILKWEERHADVLR